MTDHRTPVNDDEMIQLYRAAAVSAPPGYRDRVRARLRTAPARDRRHRFLSVSVFPRARLALLAVAVVIAGSVGGFVGTHQAQTVSAQVVLDRAVQAINGRPYTGTLVATSIVKPDSPFLTSSDSIEGAVERRIIHFTYRDAHHFRYDVSWAEPAIDAGVVSFVANGGPLLLYDNRGNVYSRTSDYALSVFDLTGGGPLAAGSFGAFQSFQQALNRLAKGASSKPQVVGQDVVAGRKADIVSLQDLSGAHIQVWIDHDRPFILKWQQDDSAQVMTPGTFSMQVKSIRWSLPSPAPLRFAPPQGAKDTHSEICSYTCSSGASGSNSTWDPHFHPGYVFVPAPTSLRSLRKSVQIYNHREMFLLRLAPPDISYGKTSYQWGSSSRSVLAFHGPYAYIQERIHTRGLPERLRTGARHHAGACTFWVGKGATGPTLSTQRGTVSISIHTNALSPAGLITYAKTIVCKVH
jgi:hypothetical protein